MNAEIKTQIVDAIADWAFDVQQAEQIAVAVVETLRGIDADMVCANAPTYSSCLSNNDIWTGFIDEILK